MTMDTRIRDVRGLETRPLFDMAIDLEAPLNIGGPLGHRALFGAARGTFEGPKLRGEVLPGGGDWALFRTDATMNLDVRITLRVDDGAQVYMSYSGRWTTPPELRPEMGDSATRHLVDPDRYYFRTAPMFETGAPNYRWLNDIVCVGFGYFIDGGVAYRVFEVL
ncbi:DUF3237 domain-containing protein [Nocardia sp. NPDC050406]|uniref:DUF3237 domain-containing protein n=1 Tax=Nocardia sp. NPDC050406 TaxID=3364318 RepID=UPI0037B699E5